MASENGELLYTVYQRVTRDKTTRIIKDGPFYSFFAYGCEVDFSGLADNFVRSEGVIDGKAYYESLEQLFEAIQGDYDAFGDGVRDISLGNSPNTFTRRSPTFPEIIEYSGLGVEEVRILFEMLKKEEAGEKVVEE